MASEGDAANTAPPQRPKLNLKPRDPARAAQLEQERQHSIKKSPFGDAKPREAVIASRVGKTEEEILKEEVKKEKLHLRLNPQQLEEKRGHEAAVKEVEDEISLEDDPSKREVLQAELAARQQKLEALMERFEKMALETALSGEAPRVSQVRRQLSGQPDALGGPVPGMGAPPGRYNPTQQYSGGRGGRGGYDYGGAPRSGYQPTRSYAGGQQGGGGFEQGGYEGGHRQGGGGGGFRQGASRGYQPAGGPRDDSFGEGFDRPSGGGRPYNQSAGYGDSDQGFFDAPSLSAGGGGSYGGGYGGGRGRGRGRGGHRDNYGGGSFGGGPYGGGKDYGEPGYGNGFGSQGIGGEIHFDTQDRF